MNFIKKLIVFTLINTVLSTSICFALNDDFKQSNVHGARTLLSPNLNISSASMQDASLNLFVSYIHPSENQETDALELLKRQSLGPGGLLHLEENYNSSRSLMKSLFMLSGALFGGIIGLPLYPSFVSILSCAIAGAAIFTFSYCMVFKKSDYKNAESAIKILDNASAEVHLDAALALFEDARNSELVTVQRLGKTGIKAVQQLLEKAKSKQQVELNLSDTVLALEKDKLDKLEANIAKAGLEELFLIVQKGDQLHLNVTSSVPTESQRSILRKAISETEILDELFQGLDMDLSERILIEEKLWHGFFDLLYRQDQNESFTPEYITLYKDGVIFKDPGVLRCLALDIERSQEDFMVEAIKKTAQGNTENLDFLVFATGSGVLVNNILKNVPLVKELIEYDRSQNSNNTADKRRRQGLPENLYQKVRQITADVRDFSSQLKGKKSDFILSTASLRLMSDDARQSVIDFIISRKALKNNGSLFYMDTKEHSLIIEKAAAQLRGAGFDVAITRKDFAGHRDAMFYIFVHQYLRNPLFKKHIDELMAVKQKTDLYDFLYKMAGHRNIPFLILQANQKNYYWQSRKFKELAQSIKSLTMSSFKSVFDDISVRVEKGPSSRVTISMLGKDPNEHTLESYDVFVDTPEGQISKFTVYDGRSIGLNTLILGRLVLEAPIPDDERVLMTQHVLTSRYGYEESAENLKKVLQYILPLNMNVDDPAELEKFSNSCVGLTKKELSLILSELKKSRPELESSQVLEAFSAYTRNKYPSQEAPSFPKSAGVIKKLYKGVTLLAKENSYSSISGLISLPDGLQNMLLYQKIMGANPVINSENREYFETVNEIVSRKGMSIKEKAWELSKTLDQLLVLIKKDINPVFPEQTEPALLWVDDVLGQSDVLLDQAAIKNEIKPILSAI